MTVLATNVPRSRSISTTSPVQGGGNLGANRTISLVDEAVELIYGSMPAYSVKREGGDPTGVSDSSSAVASAVAKVAALATGGIVVFGPGTWKFANVGLPSGVHVHGAGSGHSPFSNGSTILKPSTTAAGTSLFKLDPTVGEYLDNINFRDLEFDGTLYSGAATMPSAPTSTVESEKVRAIDFRQSVKLTVSNVNTTTETITTSTAHGFTTGDPVCGDIASGGTLPTGLTIQPAYFYANVTGATTLILYDTQANAIAGGATGKVNLSTSGSGTFYITRTVVGTYQVSIERCYFHNWDECFRGSSIVDRSCCYFTRFAYSYVGFQGQEHPRFLNCRFQLCYFGLTGRFVDMILDGSINMASCYYGLAPYDPTGAGGTSFLGNNTGSALINNCTISGEFYQCVVAVTLGTGNTVTPETYVVGSTADSGSLTYSRSIGVRIQGQSNHVFGKFGEGSAATSFGYAAVFLDRNGNSNDCSYNHITVTGNVVSAVSGNAFIAGGDTNQSTPKVGVSDYGGYLRVTIRHCNVKLANMRFIYAVPNNGTLQHCTISDNTVANLSGGSNTMGSSAGIIEAALYTGCEVQDNRIENQSGTCGSAVKGATVAVTSTRFLNNKFVNTAAFSSGAALDFTSGAPSSCVFKNNDGYVSENAGTGTFGSGNTTLTVTHGLARTPDISLIRVTPQSDLTSNGAFWISGVTSTQFTINVKTGSGTPAFSWHAALSA